MKKKRIFLLLCFFICLFILLPCTLYANKYSLNDLYKLALERSETIKIAEEDLYISELSKDKAAAELLPTLSAFGYHTRYSEEKRKSGFLLQPKYSNEWGLRLDETFSLGGREFTSFRIAKEGIRKSGFDLHAVKESYLLDVTTQYYSVLRAKKGLEISITNVERLTKHRDAAEIRLKVGEVIKTVLLRAEAELAGARSELIKSENNLEIAKIILAKTVGISEDYDIKDPFPGIDHKTSKKVLPYIESLIKDCNLSVKDCLKKIALEERAEIKAVTTQKEISEKEVKYAQGSYWPTLSIEGVYSKQENEPSSSFALEERIYGGLKLDFPFFEGGLRRAEVRESKARLRQAELNLTDLINTVNVEVENSYLMVKREAALLRQVQAELAFARENHKSVTKQFQYGLADSIDTIDANTLLVNAERDLINAKYIFQLAILRLKRATGTLLKTVTGNQ